jgi:hypothetical protein
MKPISFLFLFAVGAFAQSAPTEKSVELAHAFATEAIPHLQLKDATFAESLATIRRAWVERHPNDSFPVAVTDYRPAEGYRETNPATITLDLKNIPFMEAVRYVGTFSGRSLISVSGLIQLEGISWIQEDWITRAHDVTPAALAALGVRPNSPAEDLRRGFQQFGVTFENWMKVAPTTTGGQIVVLSYRAQQEQIAGILFLLGNGFRITR